MQNIFGDFGQWGWFGWLVTLGWIAVVFFSNLGVDLLAGVTT